MDSIPENESVNVGTPTEQAQFDRVAKIAMEFAALTSAARNALLPEQCEEALVRTALFTQVMIPPEIYPLIETACVPWFQILLDFYKSQLLSMARGRATDDKGSARVM